jgi:hypothetical protein
MECPYCGAELVWQDYYGNIVHANYYFGYPQSWIDKTGDIYKCPNSEGFETQEEAKTYQEFNPHIKEENWEEVCCDSFAFNGYFYTDRYDNLYEGYPC